MKTRIHALLLQGSDMTYPAKTEYSKFKDAEVIAVTSQDDLEKSINLFKPIFDRNLRIDIHCHGSVKNGLFEYYFNSQFSIDEEKFAQLMGKLFSGIKLNIHIFSCSSGAERSLIEGLSIGSEVVRYSGKNNYRYQQMTLLTIKYTLQEYMGSLGKSSMPEIICRNLNLLSTSIVIYSNKVSELQSETFKLKNIGGMVIPKNPNKKFRRKGLSNVLNRHAYHQKQLFVEWLSDLGITVNNVKNLNLIDLNDLNSIHDFIFLYLIENLKSKSLLVLNEKIQSFSQLITDIFNNYECCFRSKKKHKVHKFIQTLFEIGLSSSLVSKIVKKITDKEILDAIKNDIASDLFYGIYSSWHQETYRIYFDIPQLELLEEVIKNNRLDALTSLMKLSSFSTCKVGGRTPLHLAIDFGSTEACKMIIKAHPQLLDALSSDKFKETPLHSAMWKKSPGKTKLLLGEGADYNLLNSRGRKPFDLIHNCRFACFYQKIAPLAQYYKCIPRYMATVSMPNNNHTKAVTSNIPEKRESVLWDYIYSLSRTCEIS
jgi:hypothetical protein